MKRYVRGVEFTLQNGFWQGECGEGGQYVTYFFPDGFKHWMWQVYRVHREESGEFKFLEKLAWSNSSISLMDAIESALSYIRNEADYIPEQHTVSVGYPGMILDSK